MNRAQIVQREPLTPLGEVLTRTDAPTVLGLLNALRAALKANDDLHEECDLVQGFPPSAGEQWDKARAAFLKHLPPLIGVTTTDAVH